MTEPLDLENIGTAFAVDHDPPGRTWAEILAMPLREKLELHAKWMAEAIDSAQREYGLGPYSGGMTTTPLSFFPGASISVDMAKVGGKDSVGIVVKHAATQCVVYVTAAEVRAHAAALLAAADAITPPPAPVAAKTPAPDRVEK